MSSDMGGKSGVVLWKDLEHPGTDDINEAGVHAAAKHISDILPSMSPMIVGLLANMAASDWRKGHEDRVFTALREHMDLTGAYRVVAAMRAASLPKQESERRITGMRSEPIICRHCGYKIVWREGRGWGNWASDESPHGPTPPSDDVCPLNGADGHIPEERFL